MSTRCLPALWPNRFTRSNGPRTTNTRPNRRSTQLLRARNRPSATERAVLLPRDIARIADDAGHHAVIDRFVGSHPVIAMDVLVDPIDRLSGLLGDDAHEPFAHANDLLGFDLDVRGHAARAACRL